MATTYHSSDFLTHENQVIASPSELEGCDTQGCKAIDKLRSIAPDLSTRGEFTNADGIIIYTCSWIPRVAEIKALLCIVHGYGDHCMRFSAYAEEFSRHGILVFAQDLVGFGRSGGTRGPICDLGLYVRDVIQQVQLMREIHQDFPLFIYGHSLGATLSLSAVLENQSWYKGIIISGNNLSLPATVGKVSRFLLQCVGTVFPTMTLVSSDLTRLTRDESEIEKVRQDPLLAKETVKVKFGITTLKYLDTLYPRLNEVTLPILITHGELDTLCPPENAAAVYDLVSSRDRSVEVWRGCKHSLYVELEPERSEVLARYVEWVLERV